MIENRLGDEGAEAAPNGGVESQGDDAGTCESSLIPLSGSELRRAIEAVLFSLSEPITIRALSELVGVTVHDVREAIEDLRLDYFDTGRAFRLEDVAGGVQLLTLRAYEPWIRKLRRRQRESRLSPAALETLAVIAYKQPIQKADLEGIRGVNCSPILKTLIDKGLVKVVGRGEGLGRPLLYGTTRRFLESFGIGSVKELPQPEAEVQALESSGAGPASVGGSEEPHDRAPLYSRGAVDEAADGDSPETDVADDAEDR
jgi:segregation and condensation protein B